MLMSALFGTLMHVTSLISIEGKSFSLLIGINLILRTLCAVRGVGRRFAVEHYLTEPMFLKPCYNSYQVTQKKIK